MMASAAKTAAPPPPYEIKSSALHGRGLFATRGFAAGAALFAEAPLGSLQHARNAVLVPACQQCLRAIGTLEDHVACIVAAPLSPSAVASLPASRALELQSAASVGLPPLTQGFSLPLIDRADALLATPVPCRWRCGAAFCSAACRATAEAQHHVLLCPAFRSCCVDGACCGACRRSSGGDGACVCAPDAGADGVRAGELFAQQALATNEVFRLAGRLVGRVLEAWARFGGDMPRALEVLRELRSEPWPALFAAREEGTREVRRLLRGGSGGGGGGGAAMDVDEEEEEVEEEEEGGGECAHDGSDEELEAGGDADDGAPPVVREWIRDSLTILKALVRARLRFVARAVGGAAAGGGAAGGSGGAAAGGVGTSDSSAVLRDALEQWEEDLLFAPDVYERIVGAFELNNIEVRIDPPLRGYLRDVAASAAARPRNGAALAPLAPVLAQAAAARAARRALAHAVAEETGGDVEDLLDEGDAGGSDDEEEEVPGGAAAAASAAAGAYGGGDDSDEDSEDAEEVVEIRIGKGNVLRYPLEHIPAVDGTALFATICCMNHSCDPNVQVVFQHESHVGTVVALKPITLGDELRISYCDVSMPCDVRRATLKHYGFVCGCSRCEAEGGGASMAAAEAGLGAAALA